jgi:hypothetical protein
MVSMCSVSGSHVWLRAWVASAGSIVGCVERKLRRQESASTHAGFQRGRWRDPSSVWGQHRIRRAGESRVDFELGGPGDFPTSWLR